MASSDKPNGAVPAPPVDVVDDVEGLEGPTKFYNACYAAFNGIEPILKRSISEAAKSQAAGEATIDLRKKALYKQQELVWDAQIASLSCMQLLLVHAAEDRLRTADIWKAMGCGVTPAPRRDN